jgi:uncharacterized protein (DUF1697 family)
VNKYVAFLRAVNVGGRAVVTMDDLRATFERAGGRGVKTLIQSGNVLFEASARDVAGVVRSAANRLKRTSGNEPEIIVRNVAQIEAIIDEAPFSDFRSTPDIKLYVAFLSRQSSIKPVLPLISFKEALEVIQISDCDAFIVSRPKGGGLFGFPNNFIEKQLGVSATTRNWSTVTRIAALARNADDGGRATGLARPSTRRQSILKNAAACNTSKEKKCRSAGA